MNGTHPVSARLRIHPLIAQGDSGNTMNNPYTLEAMLDFVIEQLAQVLGRDRAAILPDAALVNDLGADSLDFVEFRYNIERALGVEMPHKSILDHLIELTGNAGYVYRQGRISEFSADMLHRSFFRYGREQIYTGMQPYDVMAVTTVRNWAHYFHALFDYLPEQCPDCGGHHSKLSASGQAQCEACGTVLRPENADTAMASFLGGQIKKLTATSYLPETSPCTSEMFS